jgi:anaerobic magnesium-protoporphyrin IX monomethyl ester cyclase
MMQAEQEHDAKPCVALVKVVYATGGITQPPMGLLFIGNALEKAGYRVKVFHLTEKEAEVRMDDILAENPMIVGFSIITGDPCDVVGTCCRELKEGLPDASIVFGGVHPTIEPEQCLETGYVDYVVLNEGEHTIVALADAIRKGMPVDEISGLAFLRDGVPVVNPFGDFERDLDSFDMDWDLIDVDRYVFPTYDNVERVISGYIASRGCPHACAFCYNHFFNRRRWRHPSAAKVVRDVNRLIRQYRLGGVLFMDDNFTAKRSWALEILDGLEAAALHLETRIDYIKGDFLAELAKRKVRSLFIGVESGSDRMLELMAKGFGAADIHRALDLLKTSRVPAKLSFIFGMPTETVEEHRATLRLIVRCIETLPRVGFTLGFYLPYPGTPMFELAVKGGFEKPQRFEDWVVLDRWGSQDLPITWTAEPYLTPSETARLRNWSGVLLQLRDSRRLADRVRYRLVRWRFLNSGTRLVRFGGALKQRVGFLRRYAAWRLSPKSWGGTLGRLRWRLGMLRHRSRLRGLARRSSAADRAYYECQFERSFSRREKQGGVRTRLLIDQVAAAASPSPSARVLCVGCRNVFEIEEFEQRGFGQIVGIDLFSNDRRIRVMDMHELTFPDDHFDVVYASHSLEHARDLDRVIAGIVRVARPGAVIGAEVPLHHQRGADMVDFDGVEALSALFTAHGADVLWTDHAQAGTDTNPEGTDVARVVCRLGGNGE